MKPFKNHALWLVPILIMLAITPFTPEIDLSTARWMYTHHIAGSPSSTHGGFSSNYFFNFLFRYGVIPAQVTCGVATLCFILSYYYSQLRPYRIMSLVLSLAMIIGSGIIAHQLLKETWGRPRPKQLIEFGGKQEFRPYYKPILFKKPPEPSKSFPSGHSTCGFYFFILYFLGRRYNNITLKRLGLGIGFGLGILLSLCRVVQGGHYISDVLFAALLMWETAYFVDWLIFKRLELDQKIA